MIKVIQGDITTLAVDAIVNAAKRAVWEVRKFLSHAETRRRGDAEKMRWKSSSAVSRSWMLWCMQG